MKVKTVEELRYMSEELQIAYVHKCIAYFEEKYGEREPKEDEEEEYGKLMEIFRYSRINDMY